MSKIKVLDTALSIIDKHIRLDHKEIARIIYGETGYCDQDYNKFLSVISDDSLTLRDYIRKRRLYLAVCDMIDNPQKPLADIALEYRYSDQSAFSRAVKKEYGKTPAELRKTKEQIPDIKKTVEQYLSNKSRLDSVIERMISDKSLHWEDNNYFDIFIRATEEFGFDVSTCCLISELSEKLDIPFGRLMDTCFDMVIDYHSDPDYIPSKFEYAMDIGITSDKELYDICTYFNCEYYDLTSWHVHEYHEKIKAVEGENDGTT